jgi:retron-type reverse transcriptase
MKRHGNLWGDITSEENIQLAYKKARKHKSNFRSVKRFELDEERNLKRVRQSLLDKTFTTSQYTSKLIYEPKKRVIYALPFSPDRIVQHALMNVLAPIFDRLFIDNSFACREGKGQHAGSLKTREFIKKNKYCLKCDISKFYPSINHEILLKIIKRKIKCPDTLWLVEDIVNSFPGETNAPIGNLTSQWFGNLYMNELDTYVKQELKIKDYIRYCDDFCLFHNDKKVLNEAAVKIENFANNELKLKLSKCDLFPVSRGVDFLGYRHFNRYTLLRKSTAKRVKKRIRALPKKNFHAG